VAWDLDRDDWRTFRVDRIAGRVGTAGRGTRREVPGGDAAAYVRRAIRATDAEAVRGRVRLAAPAALVERRVPRRYATVQSDGDAHCIVTTTAGWSSQFVVWMATLDVDLEILDPPELATAARAIATRLTAVA
jgi:predicted DNA-binding transcriptional regulator YafY